MSKYKRMTDEPVNIWYDENELYARLYELENKIENGTLIELPCKVGQECWFVLQRKDTAKLYNGQVNRFEIYDKIYIKVEALHEIDKPNDYCFGIGEVCFTETHIGDTLFFDKAEAKKRLAELRGEK